jgi:hypothetical protein
MKNKINIYQNSNSLSKSDTHSHFINHKQRKEITINFIKEAILDIIRFRINKNSYEEEDLSSNNSIREKENEFEHINLNSFFTKDDNNRNRKQSKLNNKNKII